MDGTPYFRTDLYAQGCPKLMTVDEYIPLIDSFGLKYTAELKTPEVKMPFNGYTQEQYAQDLVNKFIQYKIDPSRVWLQSFLPDDIFYWLKAAPAFGAQAVYLDERVDTPAGYANATASLAGLAKKGVKIMAPAMFALTKVDAKGKIVPSEYAVEAKKNGLEIVAWSYERSGWLQIGGGGYYYDVSSLPLSFLYILFLSSVFISSPFTLRKHFPTRMLIFFPPQYVKNVTKHDGDMYVVLDVLAQQVGIKAMFSDWPATVTYYANCFGL